MAASFCRLRMNVMGLGAFPYSSILDALTPKYYGLEFPRLGLRYLIFHRLGGFDLEVVRDMWAATKFKTKVIEISIEHGPCSLGHLENDKIRNFRPQLGVIDHPRFVFFGPSSQINRHSLRVKVVEPPEPLLGIVSRQFSK
jgi:hypothetical protein